MGLVDQIIKAQYQRQGMQLPRPYGGEEEEEFAPLPYPMPIQPFYEEEVRKASETPWYSFATKPLSWLVRALGAGEYGVASFARSIVKASQGEETADPITSFVRGVAAGFHDDPAYQTRMTDVLSELGWTPESGTGESWTKEGVGFALGMMFDPVTWLTGGTAAAARTVSKGLVGRVAKEAGLELAEGVGRKALSKRGGRLMDKIVERGKAEAQAAAAAGEEFGAAVQLVGDHAAKTLARLTLPTPGLTVQKAIAIKGEQAIDDALEVLGKAPGEASREWFVTKGYKELLDPGGLKIKNPFTWEDLPLVSGETFSKVFGVMTGAAWAKELPLIADMSNKLTPGVVWSSLTKPVRDFGEFMKKSMSRFSGSSEEARNAVAHMEGLTAKSFDSIRRVASGLLYGKKGGGTMTLEIHGAPVTVNLMDSVPLAKGEQHLLARLLIDANYLQIDPSQFNGWFKEYIKTKQGWLKERGINLKTVTDADAERLAEVGENIMDMWKALRTAENDAGIGGRVIERYFPHLVKGPKLADVPKNFQQGTFDWFNQSRVLDLSYDKVREMFRKGEVRGVFDDDLQKIILARLGASASVALEKDFARTIGSRLGKVGVSEREGKMLRALIDRSPQNAHLTMSLAESVRGFDIPAPPHVHKAVEKLFTDLRNAKPDEVLDTLSVMKLPPAVSDDVAKQISARYQGEIAKLEEKVAAQKLSGTPVDVLGEKLAKMKEGQAMFESRLAEAASEDWMSRFVAAKVGDSELTLDRLSDFEKTKSRLENVGSWRYSDVPDLMKVEAGQVPETIAKIKDSILRNALSKLHTTAIPHQQLFRGSRVALRALEDNLTRARTLTDSFELTKKALQAGVPLGKRPFGVPHGTGEFASMAHAARNASHHVTKRMESIRSRVKEIEDGFSQPVSGATMEQMRKVIDNMGESSILMTELRQLESMASRLPDAETIAKIYKNRKAYDSYLSRVKGIVKHAEDNGYINELPALVARVSTGKSLDSMSIHAVRRLENIIANKKGLSRNDVIAYIEPKTNVVRAESLGKWEVNHPVTGEKIPLSDLDIRPADLRIVNEMFTREEIAGSAWKPLEAVLTKTIDYPSRWMKNLLTWQMVPFVPIPRVAFFTRNAIDLATKTVLGFGARGLLPGSNWKLADVIGIAGKKEGKVVLGDLEHSYDDIRKILHEANIWRYDTPRLDLHPTGTIQDLISGFDAGNFVAPYMVKQRVLQELDRRGMQWANPAGWGSAMENAFTVEATMAMLNKNMPVDEIIARLRETFWDFNNVTPFERYFMKRATLFYGFMRQAVPWALKTVARAPVILGAQGRIRDLASDTREEVAAIPKWVRDYPFITLKKTDQGIRVMSLRNVFSFDVIADMIPSEFENAFGMMNPIVTAPVELIMGRDLYMNRDLEEDRVLGTSPSKFMLESPVGDFLKARAVKLRDGKEYIKVDSYRWHALRKLFFGRLYAEVDDIAQGVEGNKPMETALLRIALGFKVMDAEYDRRRVIMQSAAERAHMKYNQAVKSGDEVGARKILEEIRYR